MKPYTQIVYIKKLNSTSYVDALMKVKEVRDRTEVIGGWSLTVFMNIIAIEKTAIP